MRDASFRVGLVTAQDRISLSIFQLAPQPPHESFSERLYLYLPRLLSPAVLADAVSDGLGLLLWKDESFAYADSFDDTQGRYLGLRYGQTIAINETTLTGLLVRPDAAQHQRDVDEAAAQAAKPASPVTPTATGPVSTPSTTTGHSDGQSGLFDVDSTTPSFTPTPMPSTTTAPAPKRFYGSVELDATRVGRDAGRIADELIAHLSGLIGAKVKVTLEIEAEIPSGAPDHVVRIVTENGRTLKFTSQGFEEE